MKKVMHLVAVASVLLLCGCSQKQESEQKAEHITVKPLPAGIDPGKITDATVVASFSADDFNWTDGKLKLEVYAQDTYSAADMDQLKIGDTLVYNGTPTAVSKIQRADKSIAVNGDIDEGGALLQASDKGDTYRAVQLDDHPVCTKVAAVTLPLSPKLTIIDCRENPTDPSDTIRTDQEKFVKGLKDYKRNFSYIDTRVKIANGAIVGITRFWIP